MPQASLEEVVLWAGSAGFDSLEVSAWPTDGSGPSHIDVARLDEAAAKEIARSLSDAQLEISAIGYYENNLHADPAVRERVHAHLRSCIDAAALLGVPYVGTFVGRDVTRSVAENLSDAEIALPPLVTYARERRVSLVVENCPMEGWHPDGYPGNLAYSPELWEWMFELGFYLNYDPSHLIWLGIDPVEAVRPYVSKVIHAQAKDTEVDPAARTRFSVFGKTRKRESEWDVGWWRYRVPGRGQVDWLAVIDALDEGGFTGHIAIEHEDPVWGGTPDRVKRGLEIARDTLRPLVGPVNGRG
ncbi:sugar phosphate isomerase/epimerase [Microbacterium sp. AK009]|uniref:sugar phosphate isomerase/epimerase family protein n=1 Tax=Microbacterium sp. AK009 TaxID=2723068 RepID=UPI001C53F6B0|nr:sugar phosphate isomerase/epimerase [Microbacterium sp. AK009]